MRSRCYLRKTSRSHVAIGVTSLHNHAVDSTTLSGSLMSDDDTDNQLAQSIVMVDRNSSPFVSLTLFGFFQLLSSDRTTKAFRLEDQSDFYFQSISLFALCRTPTPTPCWRLSCGTPRPFRLLWPRASLALPCPAFPLWLV